MARTRAYSPYAREAARVLGQQVRLARQARRWTLAELAERTGLTPPTVRKVERGDLSVGLGAAFEVAALLGVPLFHEDRGRLAAESRANEERLALLPRRVHPPDREVDDDF